jgi:hypothetical protein
MMKRTPVHTCLWAHPHPLRGLPLVRMQLVVMDDEGGPCQRVWCLLELWTTVRVKGPDALHLVMPKQSSADLHSVFQKVGTWSSMPVAGVSAAAQPSRQGLAHRHCVC